MTDRQARILIVLLAIVVVLLAAAALRATYFVTMPLAVAFFLTVFVWPVHANLRRLLHPKLAWLGIAATMLCLLLVLGSFITGIWYLLHRIAAGHLQEYVDRAGVQWQRLAARLRDLGLPVEADQSGAETGERLIAWAQAVAASATGLLAIVILILFFVLLMLIEADLWKDKVRTALRDDRAARFAAGLDAVTRQVRAFLIIQVVVAASTATVTGLWLWFMGVPFVLLWTMLTFLLDFIPNIGPILAVTLTGVVALATLGVTRAAIAAVGLFLIQQMFGNYIDPLLKGRHMAISPLVVLACVIFWTWTWGPVGAVIAVPMTATLIIVCAHVPVLQPVALLLSRTADECKLAENANVPDASCPLPESEKQ